MLEIGGGGRAVANIKYDSATTLENAADVQEKLWNFTESNKNIHAAFNRIFADLSGETIDQFQEVVQNYLEGAELAQNYLDTLMQLVGTMDNEIKEAEQSSKDMFDQV